jgi:hypothetical protein
VRFAEADFPTRIQSFVWASQLKAKSDSGPAIISFNVDPDPSSKQLRTSKGLV